MCLSPVTILNQVFCRSAPTNEIRGLFSWHFLSFHFDHVWGCFDLNLLVSCFSVSFCLILFLIMFRIETSPRNCTSISTENNVSKTTIQFGHRAFAMDPAVAKFKNICILNKIFRSAGCALFCSAKAETRIASRHSKSQEVVQGGALCFSISYPLCSCLFLAVGH